MAYWFLSWLDRGWGRAHAKLSRPSRVAEIDRHPVLFYIGTVPLSTWLSRPRDGVDSVRRHVEGWRRHRG